MNSRRHFLGKIALAGAALPPLPTHAVESERASTDAESRAAWVATLTRVAEPVLANLAANQLKARMPVEAAKGRSDDRRTVTHLEALGRTLGAADTFDAGGWLRIGLAGHQPALGETYISTGSLYLCTFAFLPLGLGPTDEFWAAPPADWTSRKLWSGADLPADHAI